MARFALISAPYTERSLIASAQRSVNLYAESNAADPGAPVPITYYPTPGSQLYAQAPVKLKNRCTYRTSLGTGFTVIGPNVYFLASNRTLSFVGSVTDRPSQVYMADNGIVAVLVDGQSGWVIELATNNFAQIIDPSFYGADFVVYLNTFFVFNRPATNQFYISLSEATFGMLSGTGISDGDLTNGGNGYDVGVYNDVPLTGGSGQGATANITVSNGKVISGTITDAGTGYTTGVYPNVAFTGGAGTGFIATVTIAGGVVTVVTPTSDGLDYNDMDVLSFDASIVGGTGSGFAYTVGVLNRFVSAVELVNPGIFYVIGDVLGVDNSTFAGGIGGGFAWTITAIQLGFDPLDIAAKSGSADPIVGITAVHNELWLIGELTTEVWYGTGAADFYFQQVQGAFIDHGCVAPYSIAYQDVVNFWLMQDREGDCLVIKGGNYATDEISTPAIVQEFKSYEVISDAIGFCFQIADHAYYALVFPSANKSWLYDLKVGAWCEWNWFNQTLGVLQRTRANCCMFVYGANLIGDYEAGIIWELRADVWTDGDPNNILNLVPIQHIRSFPHLLADFGEQVTYNQFMADMAVGEAGEGITDHFVSLRWSDDRGKSFGNPLIQTTGAIGEYQTSISWWRLGQARDRIFELSWSSPIKTALNGAWMDRTGSGYASVNGQRVRGT